MSLLNHGISERIYHYISIGTAFRSLQLNRIHNWLMELLIVWHLHINFARLFVSLISYGICFGLPRLTLRLVHGCVIQ